MQRLQPGLVLAGRYTMVRHVASGGMGQVWEAFDETLERTVALKIMHPHTQDEFALVERFRDEARFAAQLSHPNTVTIHDFGEHDGLVFLVMEFVDGPTLGAVLAAGPLSAADVRRLLGQLAAALAVAHAAGIIHRDIKPANILINGDQAQLMDFGIARSIDTDSRTLTGNVLGTAHYLSPEQAMGQTVGPPTDVYGLGVLAHEMLSSRKPFDKGTPIATALAHVREQPPSLPEGTPPDLEQLVTACLAKDPDERPTAALIARLLTEQPAASLPSAEAGDADATILMDPLPRRALVDE
ncbi:MAG: serine/threonine-protein kinase [Propionibacteriaceae bacterium]|nr:serine/threonine-protein kinase [Propionibacteriaceae bacterium]